MTVQHIVQPGECIVSIAARHGVTPESIWDHSDNRALRDLRGDRHVLLAGDEVTVPTGRRPLSISPGNAHRFSATIAKVSLRMRLIGDDGEPQANAPFALTIAGETTRGTTSADGIVEVSVSARAERAELMVDPGSAQERSMSLLIGHLDPLDSSEGPNQRLRNLGFHAGEGLTAKVNFQRAEGLDEGESLDAARLQELHGL